MDQKTRTEIDFKAMRIAGDIKKKESELINTLQEVEAFKIFEDFDLTSLFTYCTVRLGLSEDRAYTYMKIARFAEKVPAMKVAIEKNELSLSAAKKLVSVITVENQASWLAKAKTSTTRQLERDIAKEKPETKIREQVKPVADSLFELRCALSLKGEKLLTRALDLISSQRKKAVQPGEAIEAVLEEFIERHDPIKKAERAVNRKKIDVPVVARPGKTNGKRTSVPRPVAHIVTLATNAQCTHLDFRGVRCPNRRWVERHHKQEVSRGGLHTPHNLTMLCSSHHRLIHKKGFSFPNNQIPLFPK